MAYEGFQVSIPGLVADADLTSYQYHFVYLTTNHTVGIATSTVAFPIGVLQNKPSGAGDAAEVCGFGVTKVVAGDTLTISSIIRNSSVGHAVAYDPALTSSNSLAYGVGRIIDGGSSSELVTAFIQCAVPMYYRATA